MKKLLTITDVFNDELTGYVDKISSVSMIIDPEEDCKCTPLRECMICFYIKKYGLTDLTDELTNTYKN